MNRKKAALLLSFVALSFIACGNGAEDAGGQSQTLEVQAFDFRFEPETLVVEPSASVTIDLTNSGENLHSFTVDDFDLEIEANGGQSVSSTFTVPETPGAYDFYCKYHPDEMQGTISIGGADDPANDVENTEDDEDDDDLEVEVEDDDDDV